MGLGMFTIPMPGFVRSPAWKIHSKQLTDKRYDCSACHKFTKAN